MENPVLTMMGNRWEDVGQIAGRIRGFHRSRVMAAVGLLRGFEKN